MWDSREMAGPRRRGGPRRSPLRVGAPAVARRSGIPGGRAPGQPRPRLPVVTGDASGPAGPAGGHAFSSRRPAFGRGSCGDRERFQQRVSGAGEGIGAGRVPELAVWVDFGLFG